MSKKILLLVLLMFVNSAITFAASGFELTDTAGTKHSLHQYQGKWVVVNYWATWCPPCLEEIPDLVALYDDRKDTDVMVIGIVFDYETTKEVATYVDDMLMSYPIVLGDESVSKQIGSASALPTTYIYNPRGKLVKVKRGLVTRQYLDSMMVEKR
ncbi:MAG: TlpA disulfide reductase family protein [Methylophilaceae bacterium]